MNAPVPIKPIRSPSYPNAALSEAISQVRKIEQLYRSSPVDREVAAKIIGYSSLSGPANKALAALAQYGLVERAGKGEMRVTSRAQAILHPNNDDEQRAQLKAAAMEPQLFRELQERFPNMVPPEDGVVTYLNRQGFNQTAIRPAAKAYLQTLRFLEEAGVNESHGANGGPPAESNLPNDEGQKSEVVYGGARVGDLIQWESQGELRLEKPMRVRLVTDDGQWVAVEGSETGIPMSEVIVQDRPAAPPLPPPRFSLGDQQGAEIAKPADGEAEWIRTDLGSDTKVRLIVKGEMGPKQIGKLIKLLKAQQAVLSDDEDEDDLA